MAGISTSPQRRRETCKHHCLMPQALLWGLNSSNHYQSQWKANIVLRSDDKVLHEHVLMYKRACSGQVWYCFDERGEDERSGIHRTPQREKRGEGLKGNQWIYTQRQTSCGGILCFQPFSAFTVWQTCIDEESCRNPLELFLDMLELMFLSRFI